MRRVTCMHESCHTCEYTWMSRVTCINESCHTCKFKCMSHVIHIYTSYVTHINKSLHIDESCQTYEWVMSHVWMSHITGVDRNVWVMCSIYTHECNKCLLTWTVAHCWRVALGIFVAQQYCVGATTICWGEGCTKVRSKENAPPGGGSYLLCSLIKNRV